jgi:hypothetical protein
LATQQPAPKDEFESTIDYRDRLARLSSSPLFGGIYRDSFLAFVFSPSSGTALSSHYDADLSVLDITLKFSISNVFGFSPSLLWALTERKMGSYTGRTSFGRAVRVSKFQYDSTELITDPDGLRLIGGIKPRGGSLLDGPVFKSGVFMPPSAARLQKPNVRALVIGKLTRDPVLSKTQRIEATVRSPVETSIIQTAVKLRVSEIWFYDFPTGNVLARFRFSIPPPVEGGLPQPMILGGHPNP